MSQDLLLKWEYALGERLFRFVLNKDSGGFDDLSAEQQGVLEFFESGAILGAGYDPRLPSLLATVQPGSDHSVAWDLRRQCGGSIPEPTGVDDVAQGLTRIARDVYCILLSPPDLTVEGGIPGRSLPAADPLIALSQAVYAHPTNSQLEGLLSEEAESWNEVTVESAMAKQKMALPTPDSVISVAAGQWRHQYKADVSTFMEEVAICIHNLKQLAAGEVVRVPAFIGLQGLKPEAQDEHEMVFGRLRPPTEDESRYAPFSEISPRVDSVVVTDIEIHPSDGEDEQATHLRTTQERLTTLARSICLACALDRRDEEEPQSSPAIAWITEVPPFGGSGSYRPGPLAEGWAPLKSYRSDQLSVLADWVNKITTADLSHVGIAVDRLLRACAEREWGEALIDAVVAWENLLGTRNETTYRVTAALTVLCEDDLDLRVQRQKELEQIYEARSRLIHGDTNEAEPQMRDRSIQVGLEALARLIVDHPALLGLAKSRKRSDQLLLGIAGISE